MKILIVEDEKGLVEPLVYSLNREGFEVLVAYDGLDGLRQAQLKAPDLIVLDLMLPGLDGKSVCRALRANTDIDNQHRRHSGILRRLIEHLLRWGQERLLQLISLHAGVLSHLRARRQPAPRSPGRPGLGDFRRRC